MASKLRILPDQCVFKQGDVGDAAFLILSGSFNVERDEVKVGKISSGEIFGELSLILGEKRKATIRAVTPSEIIEIKPSALKELLLSSSLELHKYSNSWFDFYFFSSKIWTHFKYLIFRNYSRISIISEY